MSQVLHRMPRELPVFTMRPWQPGDGVFFRMPLTGVQRPVPFDLLFVPRPGYVLIQPRPAHRGADA